MLLAIGQTAPQVMGLKSLTLAPTAELTSRYLGTASRALYLIRPDQIIAARWVSATPDAISQALTAIWQD